MKDRGWQQAFESLYPLKFNRIEVREGDLVYIDVDPEQAAPRLALERDRLEHPQLQRSRDRPYPSPIHTDGVVFDTGRAFVDGNADFLAVPYPGVHALYRVENVPLDRLRPIIAKANVTLTGGTLSSQGEVEYGPRHREARIAEVTVRGLRLDYPHTPATAAIEKAAGQKVKKVAENPQPDMPVAVKHLRLIDGNVALVTPVKDHRFRFFVDRANLDVDQHLERLPPGPDPRHADRALPGHRQRARLGDLPRPARRRQLRLSCSASTRRACRRSTTCCAPTASSTSRRGSSRSTPRSRSTTGGSTGYVKPLIEDLQVYDAKQDQNKPVLKKLYEKVVGGVAHVLENHKHDQVATVADLSGPLSEPNTSTWEIIVHLISNAFVKAILPGFEREANAGARRAVSGPCPVRGAPAGRTPSSLEVIVPRKETKMKRAPAVSSSPPPCSSPPFRSRLRPAPDRRRLDRRDRRVGRRDLRLREPRTSPTW